MNFYLKKSKFLLIKTEIKHFLDDFIKDIRRILLLFWKSLSNLSQEKFRQRSR